MLVDFHFRQLVSLFSLLILSALFVVLFFLQFFLYFQAEKRKFNKSELDDKETNFPFNLKILVKNVYANFL